VLSILRATAADGDGILACLSAAFAEYRDDYTSGAHADTVLTTESITKRLQEMTVFVATRASGEIVGTIACSMVNAEEGHIRGMAVLPASRGTGIAARLFMQAESHFRERNYKRISLDTTAPLETAIRLYERFGLFLRGRSKISLACRSWNTSKRFSAWKRVAWASRPLLRQHAHFPFEDPRMPTDWNCFLALPNGIR
jgi:ribosomal protein S18 acetylase RimI-like enzyme